MFPISTWISGQEIGRWVLLRTRYTIVIMCISRLVCLVSRRSSNEVCRNEKSTKNRKTRSTNMSRVLVKDWQALIAFACYDSPSRIKRGASLSDAAIDDRDMSSDDKNSRLPAYSNSYCCSPNSQSTVVSLHIRHNLRYVHGTCERTVLFGTVSTTQYRPVRKHSDIPVTKSGM